MKLLKLKAENIFSLGKIEVDLKDRGLILITGYSEDEGSSNGAGKSSISSKALSWVLFGTIPGDITANEVINRHIKGKSYAELDYIDNNGSECKIVRSRGNSSSLKLFVEGADVSSRNSKETQETINLSIGRDFHSFLECDYFGQSKELGYASLTSKQQKDVLEQILPMEKLEVWADFAKREFKKIEELEEKKNTEYRDTIFKIKGLDAQLAFAVSESLRWDYATKEELKETKKQQKEIKKRTDEVNNKITELQNQVDKLSIINPITLNQEIKNSSELLKKENAHLTEISKVKVTALRKLEDCERQLALKKEVAVCPVCKQSTASVSNLDHETGVKLETMVKELSKNISYLAEQEKKQTNLVLKVHTESVLLQNKREANEENILKKNVLSKKIGELNSHAALTTTAVLKEKIKELESRENPHTNTIKHIEKQMESFKKEKKALGDEKDELSELSKDYLYWFNVYNKDFKLKLFESACPFLDSKTAQYMGALGNDQIHVEFSTIKHLASGDIKEDFSVKCFSDTGGNSYGALSGGEKKMVSFAIGLALADLASTQTSGSSDFMILDEPFEQLDERNSESIVNYLNEGTNKSTILLISNEEHLKQLVPQRLHVVKRGGITNVV